MTSQTTMDHETIRRWAEERGGVPATVAETHKPNEVGVLRIHFPDYSEDEESFEQISWDDFFAKFDEEKLTFLYQDKTDKGSKSRFYKFVRAD